MRAGGTSTFGMVVSFLSALGPVSCKKKKYTRVLMLILESIADHMYRMGIITMLCPPEAGIDRDHCVKLALIHDMAEALVGDITPPDNIAKGMYILFRVQGGDRRLISDLDVKHKRELDSMKYICDELLKPISETIANEFMELWMEYETNTTKEAMFVKDGMPYYYPVTLFRPKLHTDAEPVFSRPLRAHLPDHRVRKALQRAEESLGVPARLYRHQERLRQEVGPRCASRT